MDYRTIPHYKQAILYEGEVASSGTNLPGDSSLDSLTCQNKISICAMLDPKAEATI